MLDTYFSVDYNIHVCVRVCVCGSNILLVLKVYCEWESEYTMCCVSLTHILVTAEGYQKSSKIMTL